MIPPSYAQIRRTILAKKPTSGIGITDSANRDVLSELYAAEDLLEDACRLIAELLTKPHDEILDHSVREFLAQFQSTEPEAKTPCCSSSESSAPASSSAAPSES